MEIRWGNVFLALIIIAALINLPAITHNLALFVSSFAGIFGNAFESSFSGQNSKAYDLARLCVLFIFVLGVLRLMRRRQR